MVVASLIVYFKTDMDETKFSSENYDTEHFAFQKLDPLWLVTQIIQKFETNIEENFLCCEKLAKIWIIKHIHSLSLWFQKHFK